MSGTGGPGFGRTRDTGGMEMRRNGQSRRSRFGVRATVAAFVAAVMALALFGSGALAQTVRAGRLVVNVEGGFTPHKLPRGETAAITLSARSTIRTSDGSHLPALEELDL